MQKTLIASILITATAAAAYATPESDIASVAESLTRLKNGDMQYDIGKERVAGCTRAVEELRKAGKTRLGPYVAYNSVGGKEGYLSLAQAETVCREAAFYQDVVVKDIALFKEFNEMMFAMLQGTNDMTYYKHVRDQADACDKAVAALLAAKLDPSTPFEIGNGEHKATTIGELKPKLCDAAREASQRIEKQRTDAAAEERAPLLEAGLRGDKLDFVLKYDGYIFLPGKREPKDIKAYVKASTMFTSSTSEPQGGYVTHYVSKFVFKGNKKVRVTNKEIRTPAGQDVPKAAFK